MEVIAPNPDQDIDMQDKINGFKAPSPIAPSTWQTQEQYTSSRTERFKTAEAEAIPLAQQSQRLSAMRDAHRKSLEKQEQMQLDAARLRLKLRQNVMLGLNSPTSVLSRRRIAGKLDIPLSAVDLDLDNAGQEEQAFDFESLVSDTPKTAQFLADPENASLASHEVTTIGGIEKTLNGFVDTIRSLGAGLWGGSGKLAVDTLGTIANIAVNTSAGAGFEMMRMAENPQESDANETDLSSRINRIEQDNTQNIRHYDEVYNYAKNIQDTIRGERAHNGYYGLVGQSLLSGVESIGQMLPTLGAGRAVMAANTGAKAAMNAKNIASLVRSIGRASVGTMAVAEGTSTFMDDMSSRQKSFGNALAHASWNGAWEGLTEAFHVPKLFKDSLKRTGFLKMLAKNYGRETLGELAATATQSFGDKVSDAAGKDLFGFITGQMEPKKYADMFTQYVTELPENLLGTAIAVLPMSLGSVGLMYRGRKKSSDAMQKAVAAIQDSAEATQLNREPGAARDFYRALVRTQKEGTGVDNVYIDKDGFDQYMQHITEETGITAKAAAETFGIQNYDEASTADGIKLAMPFENYAADFTPAGHASALLAHTTLNTDIMTAAEMTDYQNDVKDKVAATLKAMQQTEETIKTQSSELPIVKDFEKTLTDSLTRLGFDETRAKNNAQITARMMTQIIMRDAVNKAQESGETVTQKLLTQAVKDVYAKYDISMGRAGNVFLTQKNIEPHLDSLLEELRHGKAPTNAQLYGPSLTQYIKNKLGGLNPSVLLDDEIKIGNIKRSIVNKNSKYALDTVFEELDRVGFNVPFGDDSALIDMLIDENNGAYYYASSFANEDLILKNEILSRLQADLSMAGIDLNAMDNAAVREALAKHNGERYGQVADQKPEALYQSNDAKYGKLIARQTNPDAKIVLVDTKTLGVDLDAPLKTLIAKAKTFHDALREESQTQPIYAPMLDKPVRFSGKGFRKNTYGGANPLKWAMFPYIRDIIENARVIETREPTPDKKAKRPDVKFYHWLETDVSIDDRSVTVGISLEEDASGNLFYNLNSDVDRHRQKNSDSSALPAKSKAGTSESLDGTSTEPDVSKSGEETPTGTSTLNQSISDNSDGVNLQIIEQKSPLLTDNEANIRGRLLINRQLDSGSLRIELFNAADFSTFQHESAHMMLEIMSGMVESGQCSAYMQQEFNTIMTYLGTTPEAWSKMDAEAKRPLHEQFAESFEKYLYEGKAPAPALTQAFRRFKDWLLHIYDRIKNGRYANNNGLRHIKLNSDIRGVFDRMIATDEEIQTSEEAQDLRETLVDAERLGLSKEELSDLSKLVNDQLADAQDQLRRKVLKYKLKEKTKVWKEALAKAKTVAAEEYDNSPLIALMREAATGEMTDIDGRPFALNKAELVRLYGEPFLKQLPKISGKPIYQDNGALLISEIAEDYDIQSSDDLIKALVNVPDKKTFIEDRSREMVMNELGDLLNSAQLNIEAENALNGEQKEARLKKELLILRKAKRLADVGRKAERKAQQEKTAQKLEKKQTQIDALKEKEAERKAERRSLREAERAVNTQVDAMKQVAADIIAEKKVSELKVHQYFNAMRRLAAAQIRELKKANPDYGKVASLKQSELMNLCLYRAANKVQQTLQSRIGRTKEILRAKTSGDIFKHRTASYVYVAKALAARLLGRDSSVWENRLDTENLRAEAKDMISTEIMETDALPQLTTEEALGRLSDVIQFWTQSRRDKQVEVEGKLISIEDAAKAIIHQVEMHGSSGRKLKEERATLKDQASGLVGDFYTSMVRFESWCDMMDQNRVGQATGPLTRFLFAPIKQAADRYRERQTEIYKQLTEILEAFHFKQESFSAPELGGYVFGQRTGMGKAELIHAMLHTGNSSNMKRLLVGYGWGTVNEAGELDRSQWDAFVQRMIDQDMITQEDMDRVQQIWDLFDSLRPDAQKAHKAVFGRYFDEIANDSFELFGKTYQGGYIPAIYRPDSQIGERQDTAAEELLSGSGDLLPSLQAHWGQTRVAGIPDGQLWLDIQRLRTHLNQQALFVEMAPAAVDVCKLLRMNSIKQAINAYDPNFMKRVIRPWIARAVTQRVNGNAPSWKNYELFRKIRSRAGTAIMFGNVLNALEGFFDMTAAFGKVKGRYMRSSFTKMLSISERSRALEFMRDKSRYMRSRLSNEANAINDRFEQALNPNRLQKVDRWIANHAYFMQEFVDGFTAPLVWTAAFNQAIDSQLSESEAVSQADSVVRQCFGTNSPEDLANYETGTHLERIFTQFTGYFVQRLNTIMSDASKITANEKIGRAKQLAALAIMSCEYVLFPAWIGAAIRKIGSDGFDKDAWDKWLQDIFGWSTIGYLAGMGGFGGQVINSAVEKLKGNTFSSGRVMYSPTVKAIEDVIKMFAQSSWKSREGRWDVTKITKNLAAGVLVTPVLPVIPNRLVNSANYIINTNRKQIWPKNTFDFVRGAITGVASEGTRRS